MSNPSSASETFVVEDAILSYPHLFQPQQVNGQGQPKFSAALLVKEATAKVIYEKAQALAAAHFKNGEQQNPKFMWPVSAAKDKQNYANNPRLANLFVVNTKASADYPPQVVDENRQPVLDRGKVYAGCEVAAGIRLYTYNNMGNIGIGVGLSAIMKTGDGEPLGGDSVDAKSLFANVNASPNGAPAPETASNPFGQGSQEAEPGMPTPPFLQ